MSVENHGPIHVNWAFRLPLEPTEAPISAPAVPEAPATMPAAPVQEEIDALAHELERADSPIIIAGPDRPVAVDARNRLVAAANAMKIPVVADVLSGLRGRSVPVGSESVVLDASSLLFEGPLPEPDLVIRVGNTPTAKSTRLWWEANAARHVIIDPLGDWHDPSSRLRRRLVGGADQLLEGAARTVDSFDDSWLSSWTRRGDDVAEIRAAVLDAWPTITEAHVARSLEAHLGPDDLVVASSSMPVRDLDLFTSASFGASVVANRGVNGIDGVVSTAIGAARARPAGRTVALVGDVAALHDVGGILDAARQDIDLTIVIPNNDGGGIFSFLPAKAALPADQFERYFHTGHGTSFDFLAQHDRITHHRGDALGASLADAIAGRGIHIVEVEVSTTDRLELRDELVGRLR